MKRCRKMSPFVGPGKRCYLPPTKLAGQALSGSPVLVVIASSSADLRWFDGPRPPEPARCGSSARAPRLRTMALRRSLLAALALAGSLGTAAAQSPPTALEVYPPDINLDTSRDRQSFVVQATYADGITRDVTAEAKVAVANPALAQLDKNVVYPGRRRRHRDEGRVRRQDRQGAGQGEGREGRPADQLQARRDARSSCGPAATRAAATGRPAARTASACRCSASTPTATTTGSPARSTAGASTSPCPAESLLSRRPRGKVPHTGGAAVQGGRRVLPDAHPLARGRRPARPADRGHAGRRGALPEARPSSTARARSSRSIVRAKYSDGTDRDVTSLALFLTQQRQLGQDRRRTAS